MPPETEAQPSEEQRRPPPNGGARDDDDLDVLRTKYADLEKKYGTLVNEKKKFGEDKKKLSEALKAWNSLADEYGSNPSSSRACSPTKPMPT
jgi:hypothetical protein